MHPHRPAPSPPSTKAAPRCDPFTILPPPGDRSPCSTAYTHSDQSTDSLLPRFASYRSSAIHPGRPVGLPSSAYSTYPARDRQSAIASSTRSSRSHTSYLAASLSPSSTSPSRFERLLGYDPDVPLISPRSVSVPSSTTPPRSFREERAAPSPTYSIVPTELGFLDQRNSRTLLRDLEMIVGKRLEFPMLKGLGWGRGNREKKEMKETKGKKEKKEGRRLSKERRDQGEWSWEQGGLVIEKEEGTKGRGVREGNWI